jgi:hypothetical protein
MMSAGNNGGKMQKAHDAVLTAIAQCGSTSFHNDNIAAAANVSGSISYGIIRRLHAEGKLQQVKMGRKTLYRNAGEAPAPSVKMNIPVNDRFKFIEKFTGMVGKGISPSFLLTGQAGVGKSFTVTKKLESMDLKSGEDFIVIKGHSSPLGLYRTLHDHRDQIIVFDDCDSIWKDQIAVNILKAALDSYDVRTITWNSMSAERFDMEGSFVFTGAIIFISNIDASKLDAAVVSRTITANLVMSNDEIIDRMDGIRHDIMPNVSDALKVEVIEFLREAQDRLKGLSLRTFLDALKIRASVESEDEDWKTMVLWTC